MSISVSGRFKVEEFPLFSMTAAVVVLFFHKGEAWLRSAAHVTHTVQSVSVSSRWFVYESQTQNLH